MKFDVVVGNPPYNDGLLTKGHKVFLKKELDSVAYSAAETRIDAAFIVKSKEKLLKPDGHMIFVWPIMWLQGSTWSDFRKWTWLRSGLYETKLLPTTTFKSLESVSADSKKKKPPRVRPQIYKCKPDHSGSFVISGLGVQVPQVQEDCSIHPIFFNELAKSIWTKLKDRPTIKNRFNIASQHEVSLSTGIATLENVINGQTKPGNYSLQAFASALRFADHKDACDRLGFNSQNEIDEFAKYWVSPLPSFISAMFSVDFHSTRMNTGKIYDFLADGMTVYDKVAIYNRLGFTTDEIDYVEKCCKDWFKIS
jgi:hypothetical protein